MLNYSLSQPSVNQFNASIQEPQTYTTQEIVDMLGLSSANCLHKSKKEDKPYVHYSSTQRGLKIIHVFRLSGNTIRVADWVDE